MKEKSILLIGLGRFGRHIAIKLHEMGHQVMAVDRSEARINAVLPYATNAQIGDSTDAEFVSSLGIPNYDACIVAIGDDFQSSLETASLLSELGARKVIARASKGQQEKFLLRNGADEVVYPERDSAERIAVRLSAEHVFNYIELTDEYSIYEIPPLPHWPGHTVRELDVRNKYRINILAIKRDDELRPMPGADYLFTGDEHVLALMSKEDARKLLRKI